MEKLYIVYPFGSYIVLYFRIGTPYSAVLDRLNRYRPTSGLFYSLFWDPEKKQPVDLSDRILPTSPSKYLYLPYS